MSIYLPFLVDKQNKIFPKWLITETSDRRQGSDYASVSIFIIVQNFPDVPPSLIFPKEYIYYVSLYNHLTNSNSNWIEKEKLLIGISITPCFYITRKS